MGMPWWHPQPTPFQNLCSFAPKQAKPNPPPLNTRRSGDDDLDKGGASYAVAIEYDAGVVAGPVVRAFSRSLLQDLCGGVSGGSS